MATKSHLQTVRFAPKEWGQVETYLGKNPIFESFSSLARVATLSFLQQASTIQLNPIHKETSDKRPAFLWDYDLNEFHVREILRHAGLSNQKRWLIERILLQARFDEIWCYLTIEDVERALPHVRLPQKIRDRWKYALQRWSHHD